MLWKPLLVKALFRAVLSMLFVMALGMMGSAGETPREVRVGGYVFVPYVEEGEKGYQGLSVEFLNLLNEAQSEYRFIFVPTSPKRRFDDYLNGRFDVLLFERADWGWSSFDVAQSRVIARDAEVWVARAEPGRTQAWFDDLQGRDLMVLQGYKYPFAGNERDPEVLYKRFNARATVSHEANVLRVAEGRADAAVVTRSWLCRYLEAHPELAPQLLVSRRYEKIYLLTLLVRRGVDPSLERMEGMVGSLERSGRLKALFDRYGVGSVGGAP